jgi:hypothetical protein
VPGVGRLLAEVLAISLAAVPLSLSLWALLDAARRPGWAWALCGRDRAMWIAGICLGILSVIGGLVVSGIYLTRIRPEVAAAERGDLRRG